MPSKNGDSGSNASATNSGNNTSSDNDSDDEPDIELGPVRDADTGEVVDADPTDNESAASGTSDAASLASGLREGDIDADRAEQFFEEGGEGLTAEQESRIQAEIGQEKLEQQLRESGDLPRQGEGESTVFVTGGPGTGRPQRQVGAGDSRVEAALDAAADRQNFDAFQGTQINRFEQAIGTDQEAEREDVVAAEGPQGVRPGETTAEARPAPTQDQEFEVVQASETRRNQAREDRQDFVETAQRLGLQGQLNQETQTTEQAQQINIEDQGFTRSATTAELNRERPKANLQNIVSPVTEIGGEFTTPPQGQQEFITPSTAEELIAQQESSAQFQPGVEKEFFQPNREQPGGTNIEGVSYLTQDLPRGDVDIVPTFDFDAEKTNQQVQETLQPIVGENVADQAAFTATTGTVIAEEAANIPAGIGAFAESPVEAGKQAATSFGETLAGTRGSGDVQQIRQGLIIGGLVAGPLTASGTGASGTARAASLTDDAGITTAAKRASGVEGARETARILRRKGSDVRERLVGSTSPREDRLVFQSGREGTDIPDPREDFADIDTEQLPELTQRFRDDPGPRPEVRGGRVDRPEEGLTPEEVEVLTGRDPGQLGVRQEAPGGGIQEAFTRERRVFAGGDVDPSEEFLELEDLERARAVREGRQAARRVREAATGERKGQAQLVTRQDTIGRDIDFEKPADTTDVQRARPTAEDIQGPDLNDVVDDFSRTARRGRGRDTGTDLGSSFDVSRISGLENPAAIEFGAVSTQDQDVRSDLTIGQDQRQRQDTGQRRRQEEETRQRQDFTKASRLFISQPEQPRQPIQEELDKSFINNEETGRDSDLNRPLSPDTEFDEEENLVETSDPNKGGERQGQDAGFAPTVEALFTGQTQTVTAEEAEQLEKETFTGLGQRRVLQIENSGQNEDDELRNQLGI